MLEYAFFGMKKEIKFSSLRPVSWKTAFYTFSDNEWTIYFGISVKNSEKRALAIYENAHLLPVKVQTQYNGIYPYRVSCRGPMRYKYDVWKPSCPQFLSS